MTGADHVAEASLAAVTDAGMHALWNPSRFTGITDYQSWEDALLEDDDIAGHIRARHLVPISVGGDGAFQFLVRIAAPGQAATLTSREEQYLLASSQPYLYLSDGSAHLTGIEHISATPGPGTAALPIPAGPRSVTIHLIDWDSEPGARDADGKPAATALPDFVVLINPERTASSSYRTRLQAFDRE